MALTDDLHIHVCLLCLFLALGCVQGADQPPIVTSSQYFTVQEDVTVGSVIHTLSARDEDLGDRLTFRYSAGLSGDEQGILRLETPKQVSASDNRWTCDIILNGSLERDNRPSSRKIYYEVSDSKINVQFGISMLVLDVNDNPPVFSVSTYRVSVDENEPVSNSIFQLSASDPDLGRGGRVRYFMKARYAIDEADYNATFKLNEANGKVNLIRPLDYQNRSFYHFKVWAVDEGDKPCPGPTCLCGPPNQNCNGSRVDFFITVIDMQNTPPVFEKLPYFKTVNENETVGSPVLQVTAVDGDRAVEKPNNISFSLSNTTVIPFDIDRTSGMIKVARQLDADQPDIRSRGGFYIFSVIATEERDGQLTNASSTTQVTVTVTDANDNYPEFEESQYSASVIENTPNGAPLSTTSTIKVSDEDQGINSHFKLFIETESGEPDLNFDTIPSQNQTVPGSTSVTIIVRNSSLLDYETIKHVTIKLVAREVITTSDVPRSSETMVSIRILDANDHNPVFLSNQTSFSVSEHAEIGYSVARINATDDDSGDFGQVIFSLEDSSKNTFTMDSNGLLKVAADIDRESNGVYSLMVVAMDNPSAAEAQRRRSLLRISIHILDINDNNPVWPRVFPAMIVSETDAVKQNVGYLRATDDDIGPNGELQYSIQPGSTGANLFGVNKTEDGWANLFVRSSLVGYSGTLEVTIVATDSGQEPRMASITVNVTVVDVNLHSPEFVNSQRNFTIEEEVKTGTFVANFSATDQDKGENGKVDYFIIPSPTKDSDFFSIDRSSGILTATGKLDRERQETYEIIIQAVDNGQPGKLTSSATVFVKLTDVDDNQPEFINVDMPFKMEVVEENGVASVGNVLHATDLDSSPENTVICYYLYGGDSPDFFSLDKSSGLLSLQRELDWESKQQYHIVVKASANCDEDIDPTQSSQGEESARLTANGAPQAYNESDPSLLWVRVDVLDVNDHKPTFTHREYSAGVIFDADIGSVVLSLSNSVTDEDSPKNSEHLFRLTELSPSPEMALSLDTRDPAFSVSAIGNITTAIRFRPDMAGFFLLKIQVYDKDGLTDTTAVKIYIVSNLQRVKLVFSKLPNEVERLKENLLSSLSDLLGYQIIADKIVSHTTPDGTTDSTKTDVFIHGRYFVTGEVVSASTLWRAFDFNPSASSLLRSNGVVQARDLTPDEDDDNGDGTERVFSIIVAVLAVVLVAICLVFLHMMRIYRRRLRAATTKAFASPKEQEMYEHPGTNKYYAAENPLYGKEIKSTDLEEEDKISTNSLDVNAVDQFSKTNMVEPEEEQEVVLQITDSAQSTPQRVANGHLDKVLQEYASSTQPNGAPPQIMPPAQKLRLSGRRPAGVIPGLGVEIQEGVTRFSDESLSGDSGFPDGENGLAMSKGYLEYTDI